jgi:alpha-tubulin suppressor-like RCC1 family protein
MFKLNNMLSFTSELLDSEPKNRKPAHDILSHQENWCITCQDIIADQSVLRILNRWTPYKHTNTKFLHENLMHGFFKDILYRDYYTTQERFSDQYPQLISLDDNFKSRIESVYIYREMVDKLFFITKNDEVFEVTISDHIDETNKTMKKLSEICYIGICDITCGERHVIARTKSGLLYSWGDNCCGQLGDGTICNRNKPRVIISLEHLNIIAVSCGAYHILALTQDGELFGWGYNRIGQVGNGQNKTNEWSPVEIKHHSNIKFVMISCGYHHSLALSSNGKVYSWGYNEYGQLGIGQYSNQEIPQHVIQLNNISIVKIVCGRYHSLFLASNGDIYGCGRNSSAQIGNEMKYNSNIPIIMNDFEKFKDVSASIFDNISLAKSEFNEFYICGETCDGNLLSLTKTQCKSYHELRMIMSISRRKSQPLCYVEDQNEYADKFAILGSDILNQISSQVYLATIHSYMENKSLIITDSNEIYCMNLMSEVSNNDSPKQVQEFSQISLTSIVSGATHNLALTANGKIYSWGYNNKGQLGYFTSSGQYRPKIINSIDSSIKISCGAYHSLALSESGDVYSWGHNYRGELGNNSTSDESEPYRITKLRFMKVLDIACGYNHSIAVTDIGKCYSWGNNEFGQLGHGNNMNAFEPFQVIFPSNTAIIKATCGTNHSLFLSSDRKIFACGLNHFGQIGNGTEDNQNIPVELQCSVNFVDFHATIFDHISVARSEDGDCYMWGECGSEAKLIPGKTGYRSMNEVFSVYSKSKHAYKIIPYKFLV